MLETDKQIYLGIDKNGSQLIRPQFLTLIDKEFEKNKRSICSVVVKRILDWNQGPPGLGCANWAHLKIPGNLFQYKGAALVVLSHFFQL